MKKKLTNIFSFLLMFVMVFCISANYSKAAEEGSCGPNLTWKITGDTLTVSGTGAMTSAPLGWGEESAKDAVTKIVVENGVTELDGQAFDYFKNLDSVSLPNTLTTIGYNAFAHSGMKNIVIPASVTSMGNCVFEGSSIETVYIPETVTDLGGRLFANCKNLKEIIWASPAEITGYDINGCDALETLTVKNGKIGSISNMPNLTTLTIGAEVTELQSWGCVTKNPKLKTIIIEAGKLEEIPSGAFKENSALTAIEIPANIKKIDSNAFAECTSLSKVSFHEGLEYIGSYAFIDCPSLHEVTIPKSVTTIYQWAFHGAYKTTVTGDENSKDYYVYAAYDNDFIMRGYIGTEAEVYASRREYAITFVPLGGDISNCEVVLEPSSFIYDGTAKKPTVKIISKYADVEIPNCEVIYSNNVNVGTATVIVKGTGIYTGTANGTFEIIDKNDADTSVNGITKENAELLLKKLAEYGILYAEDVEQIREGGSVEEATAYATECYHITAEYGYKITGLSIENLTTAILGKGYTESETPTTEAPSKDEPTTEAPSKDEPTTEAPVVVTKPSKTNITETISTSKGIQITWEKVENVDSYIVYRDGKKAKTTTKLTWTDTKAKKNGKVYSYKVVAVNEAGNSKASKVVKAAYVAPVKITKVVNVKGKKATVQWKKNAKATGYEVKYVLGQTEKTAKIKKAATVKTTLKKLKKGKTYTVYVRTYKTIKGKKYYSAWSAAKKVTIKK